MSDKRKRVNNKSVSTQKFVCWEKVEPYAFSAKTAGEAIPLFVTDLKLDSDDIKDPRSFDDCNIENIVAIVAVSDATVEAFPFIDIDGLRRWKYAYRKVEAKKVRLNHRQFLQVLSTGKYQFKNSTCGLWYSSHAYPYEDDLEPIPHGFVLRAFDSDELLEPTTDLLRSL